MRYVILYLRSLFCSHQWTYDEAEITLYDYNGAVTQEGIKVSATCEKCSWHRSYWKFQ